MNVLVKAIEAIYKPQAEESVLLENSTLTTPSHHSPYSINGTFTQAAMLAKLRVDGSHLMIYDEISMLLKTIEANPKESNLRQMFLTMYGGGPIQRDTATCGSDYIPRTHVNFCGK